MKKKVRRIVCMGIIAAGMLAGCGSKGDASAAEFDASESIHVTSREDGSGTRGAFVELFGIQQEDDAGNQVDYTTVEANVTNSTNVAMLSVSGDRYGISYVSLGSLDDTVKAVAIDGVEATPDNVKSGSYTIARPFHIASKENISGAAQEFMNFILSAEGQNVIAKAGYVTVDDDAASFTGGSAEGKVVIAGSSSVTPMMEKLKEAYEAVNQAVKIEIQESDSSTGIRAVMEGTCDISMASRGLKASETEGGLHGTTIALDGIAVVVSQGNPIEELSKEEVKSIFCGNTASWEEIAR